MSSLILSQILWRECLAHELRCWGPFCCQVASWHWGWHWQVQEEMLMFFSEHTMLSNVHYGNWKEMNTKVFWKSWRKLLLSDSQGKPEKGKVGRGGNSLTRNITLSWKVFVNHFEKKTLFTEKYCFSFQTLLWKLLHLSRPATLQNWFTGDGRGAFCL